VCVIVAAFSSCYTEIKLQKKNWTVLSIDLTFFTYVTRFFIDLSLSVFIYHIFEIPASSDFQLAGELLSEVPGSNLQPVSVS
jgi:hypothetical protein